MNQKISEALISSCITDYHSKNLEKFEAIGSNHIADKKIVIVGIARDIEENLDKFRGLVAIFKEKTKECYSFLYENDSKDKTVDKLKRWADEDCTFKFKSETRDTEDLRLSVSDDRTENLAYARNQCVQWVKDNHADADYVIVIDPDFRDYYAPGLVNGLGFLYSQGWDAMAGCSYLYKHIGTHEGKVLTDEPQFTGYDCWAYRHTDWLDGHRSGIMFWFYYYVLPVGTNPHKVLSAFGGSCAYKCKDYISGEYKGGDCEHVTFHQSLYENNPDFQLYVNPSQVFIV